MKSCAKAKPINKGGDLSEKRDEKVSHRSNFNKEVLDVKIFSHLLLSKRSIQCLTNFSSFVVFTVVMKPKFMLRFRLLEEGKGKRYKSHATANIVGNPISSIFLRHGMRQDWFLAMRMAF
jgi:hypothetical protein